jgi:hypothetical protein
VDEARLGVGVRLEPVRQELYGDVAVERLIECLVDDAHAAFT